MRIRRPVSHQQSPTLTMAKRPFHRQSSASSENVRNGTSNNTLHAVVDCVVIEDGGGLNRIFSLDRGSNSDDRGSTSDLMVLGGRVIPMLSTIHSANNLLSPTDTSGSAACLLEEAMVETKENETLNIHVVQPLTIDTSQAYEGTEKQLEILSPLPCDETMLGSGTVNSIADSPVKCRPNLTIDTGNNSLFLLLILIVTFPSLPHVLMMYHFYSYLVISLAMERTNGTNASLLLSVRNVEDRTTTDADGVNNETMHGEETVKGQAASFAQLRLDCGQLVSQQSSPNTIHYVSRQSSFVDSFGGDIVGVVGGGIDVIAAADGIAAAGGGIEVDAFPEIPSKMVFDNTTHLSRQPSMQTPRKRSPRLLRRPSDNSTGQQGTATSSPRSVSYHILVVDDSGMSRKVSLPKQQSPSKILILTPHSFYLDTKTH